MKYQNYRALTAKLKKKAPYIPQVFRKHSRMNLQLFAEEVLRYAKVTLS